MNLARAHALLLASLLLIALAFAGCGSNDDDSKESAATKKPATTKDADGGGKPEKQTASSEPTDDFETLKDPVNQAFSAKAPKGWTNTAYSTGQFTENRQIVTSVSPDEKTTLFVGDPKMPAYWNPDGADETLIRMADALDLMELQTYSPADEYVPEYVRDKFGELPAFELGDVEQNPETVQALSNQLDAAGIPNQGVHSVDVHFTYGEGDAARSAVVTGTTMNAGQFWSVSTRGLSTAGDADDYLPMLDTMANSVRIDPEYTKKANANHANVMAQIQASTDAMTSRHNANMQWIQNSAQAHQTRMEGLWAVNDASMASYNSRMAAMDDTQRGFLNYINEENTVAGAGGTTHQVDSGYDRYWMKSDGTYVGGDINFDDKKLLAMGLNPSDYEEVKIVK